MTLIAIATGVAALIVSGGFVQDLYKQLGESVIHSQSGHLQVARAAYFGEGSRSPEKQSISDLATTKSEVGRIVGVKRVMARLSFSGLLSNSRADQPIVGEGIEPEQEAELSTSIQLVAGRFPRRTDRYGALIGEGLAKSLQLAPGSAVTLIANTIDGAINTTELDVVGVFRSFSKDYDARAVKIPLPAAQELLGLDTATTIVVLLTDTELTNVVQERLASAMRSHELVVKNWEELNDFYANTVALYDRQFNVLKTIILFLIALGVSNSVNMAVMERMGEFGTMRALGNRTWHIVKLIMAECLLLGCAGALVGLVAGVVIALLVSAIGIPMPPPPNSNIGYVASIAIAPRVAIQAMAIGAGATIVAGLIPALRARNVTIVNALRTAI